MFTLFKLFKTYIVESIKINLNTPISSAIKAYGSKDNSMAYILERAKYS